MFIKDSKVQLYIEDNGVNSIVDDRHPYINGFSKDVIDQSNALYPRDDLRYHYGNANTMFGYVFKQIQEIPYDRYYYPIVVSATEITDIIDTLKIELHILNTIRNGQCKILLVSPYEGWSYKEFWKPLIQKIKTLLHLKDDSFVIMDGGYLKNLDVSLVTYNFWEEMRLDDFTQPGLDNVSNTRKHKFLCLNRRPSPHRIALATKMFEFKRKGILTVAKHGGFGDDFYKGMEQEFCKEFPELINDYGEKLLPAIPLTYDDGIYPDIENPNYDDKLEKFHQSYLNIITETYYKDDTLFLSEKIFKPMWHCQPFVVYGNPGTLVQLKKLGYKTFSNFIDESYDNESCAVKRLELLVDSIKDFINKPTDELTTIMEKMKPIFRHNLNNIDRRHGICIKLNLLNDLRNALYENK
jgi:hypothetical protein|tara:strand:- start:1505 stop:2734 length:1230 start_codon:yes stop_codon:yes gene_type:complete